MGKKNLLKQIKKEVAKVSPQVKNEIDKAKKAVADAAKKTEREVAKGAKQVEREVAKVADKVGETLDQLEREYAIIAQQMSANADVPIIEVNCNKCLENAKNAQNIMDAVDKEVELCNQEVESVLKDSKERSEQTIRAQLEEVKKKKQSIATLNEGLQNQKEKIEVLRQKAVKEREDVLNAPENKDLKSSDEVKRRAITATANISNIKTETDILVNGSSKLLETIKTHQTAISELIKKIGIALAPFKPTTTHPKNDNITDLKRALEEAQAKARALEARLNAQLSTDGLAPRPVAFLSMDSALPVSSPTPAAAVPTASPVPVAPSDTEARRVTAGTTSSA